MRQAIARWIVPSRGSLLGVAALAYALFGRGRVLFSGDGDVGRHIRVGRTILDNGTIPSVDLFSHTMAGAPFVPYEWLSEAITALVERWAGLPGVALMSGLLCTIAVLCVYRASVLLGAPRWFAFFGAVLALVLLGFRLLPRPHLFTMALAGIFMIVLVRFAVSGHPWVLAPLPILMLFWVNAHGGFLVGFLLMGAFLAGALLRSREFQSPRSSVRPLLIVSGVCLVATMVNPVGPRLWSHVTGYLGIDFLIGVTLEYRSPNFHSIPGQVFFLALLAGPVLWATGRVRVSRLAAGLYVLLAAAALHSSRNVSFFAIATLPWLAVWLRDFLEAGAPRERQWLAKIRRLDDVDVRLRPGLATVALVIFSALALGPRSGLYRFDEAKFPVAATDWLDEQAPTGAVFNQFRWGGYLLYKHPGIPVFIDGQTDFYDEALTREYLTAVRGRPGWEGVLDKYGVEWTFTRKNAPLNELLELHHGWEPIYSGDVARAFRRTRSSADVATAVGPSG